LALQKEICPGSCKSDQIRPSPTKIPSRSQRIKVDQAGGQNEAELVRRDKMAQIPFVRRENQGNSREIKVPHEHFFRVHPWVVMIRISASIWNTKR
jgi:hypothetical protein